MNKMLVKINFRKFQKEFCFFNRERGARERERERVCV